MNRRTDFDGEGSTDANQGNSLSGSGFRRLDSVVPFPRRDASRSAFVSAAEVSPPEASAPPSLGSLTQAVVLRLANKRIRVQALTSRNREAEHDEV